MDCVTAAALSLAVSIIPSYDWELRGRAEQRPRCGLGASRSRPQGSASGCAGCVVIISSRYVLSTFAEPMAVASRLIRAERILGSC